MIFQITVQSPKDGVDTMDDGLAKEIPSGRDWIHMEGIVVSR